MSRERITVETTAQAPIDTVWDAYTSPEHVTQWNFASNDWHCPSARADLREGGTFSSRMEARDGSMGFDFDGTFARVVKNERIEYQLGDRHAVVEFLPQASKILVRVSFDPDAEYPLEQQRAGWQAILDNFSRHVDGL